MKYIVTLRNYNGVILFQKEFETLGQAAQMARSQGHFYAIREIESGDLMMIG